MTLPSNEGKKFFKKSDKNNEQKNLKKIKKVVDK